MKGKQIHFELAENRAVLGRAASEMCTLKSTLVVLELCPLKVHAFVASCVKQLLFTVYL